MGSGNEHAVLEPICELTEMKPERSPGLDVPDVVIVFELDQGQYASAREHLDHLIDVHNLSAHVHFEDQQ